MEQRDPSVERQVWQRVFARPQTREEGDALRMLALGVMEAAEDYRRLANSLTGKPGELARRLWEGERENLACLRGMALLSDGKDTFPRQIRTPAAPPEKLLRKSFYRTRRAMTEYAARMLDGEFGEVFRKMSQREGEHCALILQLLGELRLEEPGRPAGK